MAVKHHSLELEVISFVGIDVVFICRSLVIKVCIVYFEICEVILHKYYDKKISNIRVSII
jgi:hypothetical protein